MATLPYSKTHIEDKTTGIMQNAGSASVNVATIINSKTGPLERVTLNNFDDLINYYCTGSTISANDDNTIQCVGALLNSSPVDVVRVGKSNICVGRTNNNKLIYTDSSYNVIDILTKIRFAEIPQDVQYLSVGITNSADSSKTDLYWVGTGLEETDTSMIYHHISETVSMSVLINGIYALDNNVIEYNDNSFYYTNNKIKSTDIVKANIKGYNVTQTLSSNSSVKIPEPNKFIEIDGFTYIFVGDGTATIDMSVYNNPIEIKGLVNECYSTWFLAQIISKFQTNTLVDSTVRYDASQISLYSDNLANRISVLSGGATLNYSSTDSFDSLWFVNDDVLYLYNCTEESTGLIQGTDYTSAVSATGESKNIIDILNDIDGKNGSVVLSTVAATGFFLEEAAIEIETLSDKLTLSEYQGGMYKVDLSIIKPSKSLNVSIDNVVYYCGTIPADYPEATSFVSLSKNELTYDEFIDKLFTQLDADMVIGFINLSSILASGNIVCSSNTITVNTSSIDQSTLYETEKFALISKFPSEKKLFDYSFVKNTKIEDFDVLDLTYLYKNLESTISISFDPNAVDGYGTLLYYKKYNEDFNFKNPYVYIIELNKELSTPTAETKVDVDAWGNELLMMEPSPTQYADAISKFIDYTDKDYSFIWDSGYANSILAKAMKSVALERHAQSIPSFPSDFNKKEEFISYATALDANSYEVGLYAPSFKNTFVGTFLTTVPAGLAYIVARINSFKDLTSEMQPLFGATRGIVSAPNLTWNINKKDQQALADNNINCVVTDINGTYLNFNLTSQKINSYLSEEQNVYMSNTIAHVCDAYNPTISAELNDEVLWDKVKRELNTLISQRLVAGHTPTLHAFRVVCDETLNPLVVREARQLIYKVQVQYTPSVAYIDAYVSVVRLNSF